MAGQYGLRILNYQAGALYAYNNGARQRIDYTKAMLSNSLFLDFLVENGLKTYKETYTRDIIGISFDYGSRSYDEEVKHLNSLIEDTESEDRKDKLREFIKFADENKDKFIKKSKEEIREIFYQNGVDVTYITTKKNGEIKKKDVVHYKMLFRSTGKAKKGSCMFIRDKLYDKAIDFLRMGIKLPKENAQIVEISAYAPLVSSSIVGKVKIDPSDILVIKDIKRFFKTNVVSIETDENRHCIAKDIENYDLSNEMFDGQALIDSSIFPTWGNGYILLRHHFFKAAAFCTHIQKFFKDYFGEQYEQAVVKDMWGNEHLAKDIKMITTDNALKWLKFNVSYEKWCDRVRQNDSNFGIVKTAHESKLGDVQRMSYQMINALDMDIMENVAAVSIDYIYKLKNDSDVFLDYLRKNSNYSNDYDVLVALVEQNRDFLRSSYFRDRKKEIIRAYVLNFKSGHVNQNGDNLVIVGSPYAMLLAGVGESVDNDCTFSVEDDAIQCYTNRFDFGTYLAEFRSPFNARNNLGYLHNVYSKEIEKYFEFGRQIIAVNMNGTAFQDRNNGSDQDSDSIYVTDQKDIVEWAKKCYKNFPTIVNNIPKEKKSYNNDLLLFAEMDNNLASAQRAIGESSNLAQIALTYSYNFEDKKYRDYVCILSVLAQCAIDNAKRRFDIDLMDEIKRIKKDMEVSKHKYPEFWKIVKKDFNKNNINHELKCPMNYLCGVKLKNATTPKDTLSMEHFFQKFELEEDRRKCRKVEEIIERYSLDLSGIDNTDDEEYNIFNEEFDNMINDIKQVYLSKSYLGLMSWLIDRAFFITSQSKRNFNVISSEMQNNRALLLKTLYCINDKNLLQIFGKNV